jgi:hypothetical protein
MQSDRFRGLQSIVQRVIAIHIIHLILIYYGQAINYQINLSYTNDLHFIIV